MKNEVYQFSLLNALMEGVVEQGTTAANLVTKGNQGLGTFSRMRGELVLLDGVIYDLRADGTVREAPPDTQIPFCMATHFEAQHTLHHQSLPSKHALDDILRKVVPNTSNLFVLYRIEGGSYPKIKARAIEGQQYPGQPLHEMGKTQHVFDFTDAKGTLVGFRSPESWQGFSVAGQHMHFLSSDRTSGGHVLEVSAEDVTIHVAVASRVHIDLPTSTEFNDAHLVAESDKIREVEG